MYKIGAADSPKCSCGMGDETAQHYFMICPLHNNERNVLERRLTSFAAPFTLNTIINCQALTGTGDQIVDAVYKFIVDSNRFANLAM